jgi:hypothetical protein
MNTLELLSCVRSNRTLGDVVTGIYPSDAMPARIRFNTGFILNTDHSSGEGEHWTAVYTDGVVTEYYDSYGKSPAFYHPVWKLQLGSHGRPIVYNKRAVQNIHSNTCGQHALFFLYLRAKGVPYRTIVDKIYTKNTCFNDELVVYYISAICKINLPLTLKEPILTCKKMIKVLK